MARSPVARLAELRSAGLVRHASEPVDGVAQSLPVAARCGRWSRAAPAPGWHRRGAPGRPVRRGLAGAHSGGTGSVAAAGHLAAARAARRGVRGRVVVRGGRAAPARSGRGRRGGGGGGAARAGAAPRAGLGRAWWRRCSTGSTSSSSPPRGRSPPQVASRLTARARQRGAVLVPVGQRPWPGADLTLEVAGGALARPGPGPGSVAPPGGRGARPGPGRRRPAPAGPAVAARPGAGAAACCRPSPSWRRHSGSDRVWPRHLSRAPAELAPALAPSWSRRPRAELAG